MTSLTSKSSTHGIQTPLISVENVSYRFPDGKLTIRNVIFSVNAGERIALVGPPGSGKTTLLYLLKGILTPTIGFIRFENQPLEDKWKQRAQMMTGLVFQNPDDQLFPSTVYKNVAMELVRANTPKAEINRRVENALRVVGLEHSAQRNPIDLSGGDKRRVCIAAVLAKNPILLLLDDPSSGLDAAMRLELLNLIKEKNQTRVTATTDLELAQNLADRVILIDDGEVIADAPANTVLRDKRLLAKHGIS